MPAGPGQPVLDRDPPLLRVALGEFPQRTERRPGAREKRRANQEFNRALDSTREVEITVTGRKSGREITLPVWFVREGDRLDLVPVTGTDSNWFKNVMQNPALRVRARGTQITARATPVTDPARVGEILGKFRAKYGDRDVGAYYPKPDAAVEVPLD